MYMDISHCVVCRYIGMVPSTQLDSKASKLTRCFRLFCLHYLLRCAKFTQTKRQAGKQVALLATSDEYKGMKYSALYYL